MAATHLTRITTRAKALRKKNPSLKWLDAIKKASKELAGGKAKPAAKKKAHKRPAAKKAHPKKFLSPSKKAKHHRHGKGLGAVKQHSLGIPTKIALQVAEKFRCLEQIQELRHKLKEKSLAPGHKVEIRKAIAYYLKCAKVAKQNISNLKRIV